MKRRFTFQDKKSVIFFFHFLRTIYFSNKILSNLTKIEIPQFIPYFCFLSQNFKNNVYFNIGKVSFFGYKFTKMSDEYGKNIFFSKIQECHFKMFYKQLLIVLFRFFLTFEKWKKNLYFMSVTKTCIFSRRSKTDSFTKIKSLKKIFSNLRKSEFLCFGSFV